MEYTERKLVFTEDVQDDVVWYVNGSAPVKFFAVKGIREKLRQMDDGNDQIAAIVEYLDLLIEVEPDTFKTWEGEVDREDFDDFCAFGDITPVIERKF